MIRRRTALSVSAVALLAGAPALTACGSTAHPGAAAVVGKERITVTQLQSQVSDVRDAQRSSPQAQQLIAGSSRLGQDTLIRLIQYRIVERAGEDNGIDVTRRELQEQRTAVERANGGADAVRTRFLGLGIAPDQIDQALTMDITRAKLDAKFGTVRTNDILMRTSDKLHVDVNPRYGVWDPKRGTAQPVLEPWLRQAVQPVPDGPA
ncbi:SurA N-terminal domain-containing protein [Streptomyces sp. UNOC14_S4]|uniref:SurA N-terminal domain-containing protein n=1 Tax=Streptomyces sp. UNOC14_S4 TaxID=2872340 RepID=UPI001E47BC6D|nr:SurA N-terminal domain-containing protein [Streptomyces sp. UNOC14_S4]MCC3771920.1 SurA N-terminal domain-containing protein [Streptomyces sp. UNOC14_S4]